MSVEYLHRRVDQKIYLEYMAQQGYHFVKFLRFFQIKPWLQSDDFIFVKRKSNQSVMLQKDIA